MRPHAAKSEGPLACLQHSCLTRWALALRSSSVLLGLGLWALAGHAMARPLQDSLVADSGSVSEVQEHLGSEFRNVSAQDPVFREEGPFFKAAAQPSSAELVRYERAREDRLRRRGATCTAHSRKGMGQSQNTDHEFGWCGLLEQQPSLAPLPVSLPL